MILLRDEIVRNMHDGNIVIQPFSVKQLNSNSYNFRLGNKLVWYDEVELDSKRENRTKEITMSKHGYILQPQTLYLAETVEYTETRNLVPMIDGRSSVGRLGICIHVSAGFGDIGFCGHWTLELTTIHPIRIYPNMEICQIHYHIPAGEDRLGYMGKYQRNKGVQSSQMYKEYEQRSTDE